jgi:hypothetical protein
MPRGSGVREWIRGKLILYGEAANKIRLTGEFFIFTNNHTQLVKQKLSEHLGKIYRFIRCTKVK